MNPRRWLPWLGGLVAVGAFAWGVTWMLARQDRQAPPIDTPAPAAPQIAHITATLFYGSADGLSLRPVRREVQLDDGVVAQGRQVLLVQLQPAPSGAISVIPADTALRAFYVTRQGEAFVDLSAEVVSGHPGGAQNELLTIQAIVHAVTANLPAVRRVQILVEGREVDTIAGHIDLRRPLAPDAGVLMARAP